MASRVVPAFNSVDGLLAIRGGGKKRLDKMRKYLIVGRPAVATKPSPGKAAAMERPANSDDRGKPVRRGTLPFLSNPS